MRIEIEKSSGFCFGVENAIKMAEEALVSGEKVYCLGQIVHNELEVARLENLGLVTINHKQFENLTNCKVLIRAHGKHLSTYQVARRNDIEILEATCPIVRKLQSRVRSASIKAAETEGQVAIYGKSGHAEVKGLMGQGNSSAILINGVDDLDIIDFDKRLSLFSQTTMSRAEYARLVEKLKSRFVEKGHNPADMLTVANSICGQVANREPVLQKFAGEHDVIIFVSGKESSNGKMLFEVCRRVNSSSHFITAFQEIEPEWFEGCSSIGICGATSTPRWLIKEIADYVKGMISDN